MVKSIFDIITFVYHHQNIITFQAGIITSMAGYLTVSDFPAIRQLVHV